MKTAFATALAVCVSALPLAAQTPRQAEYAGARWSYFQYETGAAERTILTGRPSLHEGQPEAVITVVSRNGTPITQATRTEAADFARALCRQSGRQFNNQHPGQFIRAGLSFAGACIAW